MNSAPSTPVISCTNRLPLNDLDRYHLAGDVIDRVPSLGSRVAYAKQALRDKLLEHRQYVSEHGEDMPEVRAWRWSPIEQANVTGVTRRKVPARPASGALRPRRARR